MKKKIKTLSVLLTLMLAGCSTEKVLPYSVPTRSDSQLASAASSACEKAKTNKSAVAEQAQEKRSAVAEQAQENVVLVEFSAGWCSDCRRLNELKQKAPLRDELSKWEVLVINVGEFENHKDLLKQLKIRAIADWRVLTPPSNCDAPLETWSTVAQRTLEPVSGEEVGVTNLSGWLQGIRTGNTP